MKTALEEIRAKIEKLNNDLKVEYARLAEKYGYYISEKKIIFLEEMRKKNKQFKFPIFRYIISSNIAHILSMPFIYWVIVPAVFLDISLFIYQQTAFRLYGIPLVSRKDFIVYDRRFLDYLNIIQKINCLYCSYVNGLFAYATEIGARTERYWCPLKAAKKPKYTHGWYYDFADYGNPEEWREKFSDNQKAFEKVRENKEENLSSREEA